MKNILFFSVFYLLYSMQLFGQVGGISLHKSVKGAYFDGYQPMENYFFYKNQSNLDFSTPETSIASFYSIQDKSTFDKYVIGGRYYQELADIARYVDTTSNNILPVFRFTFSYKSNNFTLVQYKLFKNGSANSKPTYRLLSEHKGGLSGYFFKIDERRNDPFLNDLVNVIGSLPKDILKKILGLESPRNAKEKELVQIVNPSNKQLDLTKLIDLYRASDKRLTVFLP